MVKTTLILGAFVLCAVTRAGAQESVRLTFSPVSQNVGVGDTFQVDVMARSTNLSPVPISAISIIIVWDPQVLAFEGINRATEGYNWLSSLVPNDSGLDDLNAGAVFALDGSLLTPPTNDGDALYEAHSQFPPNASATASPSNTAGLRVVSFVFRALARAPAPGTILSMPLSRGLFTETQVLSATIAGVNILNSAGLATVTVNVDCNANSIDDGTDISSGTSPDCNNNGVPDECEIDQSSIAPGGPYFCTVGCDPDCNNNGVPDGCEADCNNNLVPDQCDIAGGVSVDCEPNGVPDECEPDCNSNGVADACDISSGTSGDCQLNSIPDDCDIAAGTSVDCQLNGVPDECEPDCNANGVADECDILSGTSVDCQPNGVPDVCDINGGTSNDINLDGVPDECQAPPMCRANRDLRKPRLSYCPSSTKTIHINPVFPTAGVTVLGVEDSPPVGWAVVPGDISDNGLYDAVNRKVKWVFFSAPFPTDLTYDVVPPAGATGLQCFSGVISLNGTDNSVICGDDCVDQDCAPRISADATPAQACAGCGDCATCTVANDPTTGCENGRVDLCEAIGYACAWQSGCNDNIAEMTRAVTIWKSGELYCWDDVTQGWFVTASTVDANAGLCTTAPAPSAFGGGAVGGASAAFRATTGVRRQRDGRTRRLIVPITISAPAGTVAVALEYELPKGWTPARISDGGQWDAIHRKVKWGPFLDNLSRTVTFRAYGSTQAKSGGFTGTVSFDGLNYPIDTK